MVHLVVEYDFNPPLTDEALQHASNALAPCLEVRNVKKLRTVLSADRTRGFCTFEAPDAETLREAYRTARVPFKSVWPAQIFDFAPPSKG
jgi:hypothetical protein